MEDFEEMFSELLSNQEEILDEVKEDKEEPMVEVSGIVIQRANGDPGVPQAAKIIRESKKNGVEKGKVEAITGRSSKPAARIMRTMAEVFDHLKFKKGNNNRPSRLYHKDHLPAKG
jgi:hypothetical protein